MARAINKYGWKNVTHEILITRLTEEQASKMEVELIKKYNSTNPKYGYNFEKGGFKGNSNPNYDYTIPRTKLQAQHFENMSLKVNQYSLDGKFIKTWASINQAIKSLGRKNGNTIAKCCDGVYSKAMGYIWRYYNGGTNDIQPYKAKERHRDEMNVSCVEIDENGNIINTFKSIKASNKYYHTRVAGVCTGRQLSINGKYFMHEANYYDEEKRREYLERISNFEVKWHGRDTSKK